MAYITCPHCQHEFLLNQEETRPSQSLEDRIYDHDSEIDGLRSRVYGLESEVASGRAFPRANEGELEEPRGREEFDQQKKRYEEMTKDKYDPLGTALQEIEWLKERVEDIERAAAEQKSHINALHLSRERLQGQVAEAQALSPEQIEKVLRDTAEKKTIDVAAELRERIEKLENALNDVSEEDQERIASLEGRVKQIENSHWGDKASAAREEAIEDRVEKLEQEQTQYPPDHLARRIRGDEGADIQDSLEWQKRKTRSEKLDYIVETLSRLGYDWPAILKWLNMHPEIDLAYAEARHLYSARS